MRLRLFLIPLVFGLSLALAMHAASGDGPDEIKVDVWEDAYVNEALADRNFGTDPLFAGALSATKRYRSYLKFDLSVLPEDTDIGGAKLFVYRINGDTLAVSVHSASSGWAETPETPDPQGPVITWNEAPPISDDAYDTIQLPSTSGFCQWDVKDAVESEIDPDGYLTLVLAARPGGVTGYARFASREQPYYGVPHLIIQCGEAPPGDEEPPTMEFDAPKNTLWPPNDEMVLCATVAKVCDNCDPNPQVVITVTANEAIVPKTDGGTDYDWEVKQNGETQEIWLRARRDSQGDGRNYKILVTATDVAGNAATKDATVTVPHDQGKKLEPKKGKT